MKRQTLYMESTEISAERSAGEITSALIRAGANQIATDYDSGRIKGLRWTMLIAGQNIVFSMPARVEPIFKIINGRRAYPFDYENKDQLQAERVAWRQLLRWVQAQLAMIECGMTEAAEVFFPYMQMGERTIFERFKEQEFKAIAPPEVQQ